MASIYKNADEMWTFSAVTNVMGPLDPRKVIEGVLSDSMADVGLDMEGETGEGFIQSITVESKGSSPLTQLVNDVTN